MYTFILIDSNCNEVFRTHSVSRMLSFVDCCAFFDSYLGYQYELWYSDSHNSRYLVDAREFALLDDFEHLKKILWNL